MAYLVQMEYTKTMHFKFTEAQYELLRGMAYRSKVPMVECVRRWIESVGDAGGSTVSYQKGQTPVLESSAIEQKQAVKPPKKEIKGTWIKPVDIPPPCKVCGSRPARKNRMMCEVCEKL